MIQLDRMLSFKDKHIQNVIVLRIQLDKMLLFNDTTRHNVCV